MRRNRLLRGLVRRTADVLSTPPRTILANRFVSAKLFPLGADADYAVLMRPSPDHSADGLPVPPPELWERWGGTLDSYLATGRSDVESVLRLLGDVGVDGGSLVRVLDFGCAEGRMLRFFPRTEESELWGVDINAERIAWAQRHLEPPFFFATTTTAPHLPFEDNHFDFVYCLSVFTHISDLADAWFLELLRVTRPEGHVYLTIHDEHTVELLLGPEGKYRQTRYMVDLVRGFDEQTGVLSRDWVYFTVFADPAAQVFYDSEYLVGKWSRLADFVRKEREASRYQTGLLFRKHARAEVTATQG
jgi:SAM-dependent methyltransferase